MLNKQGLFSRRNEPAPSRSPVQSPSAANPAHTAAKPFNSSPLNSHPAAMEPSSKPAAAENANKSEVPLTAAADIQSGSRLTVGPDVKLKGAEIQDCDVLVVEGRVEATMDSRVIQIAEKGSFSGSVGIDVAEIYGHFEGELTARTQLLIHSTGRVSGKIRYGKILIEEGGMLSGDIAAISSEPAGSTRSHVTARKEH